VGTEPHRAIAKDTVVMVQFYRGKKGETFCNACGQWRLTLYGGGRQVRWACVLEGPGSSQSGKAKYVL